MKAKTTGSSDRLEDKSTVSPLFIGLLIKNYQGSSMFSDESDESYILVFYAREKKITQKCSFNC